MRVVLFRGIYCAYWREHGKPRRVSLGTKDAEEAQRQLARIKLDLNRPAELTVKALWDAYCVEKGEIRTVRSMATEWGILAPTFGALEPAQITIEHSRNHIKARRAAGRSDGTIWTELGHLRTVLNWGAKRGFIDKAPYIQLPMKPPAKDRWLTHAEARRLIEACAMPHIRLFVILGLQTAGRTEALLELTWDRVDFTRGQVQLFLFTGQRRKGRAVVPMTATARAALSAAKAGAVSPWVIEYGGRPVKSVKKAFARACDGAGIEGVTPHTLRHTAAVWMAERGASMSEIAAVLGHSDSRLTERVYARFSPDGLRKAVTALEM